MEPSSVPVLSAQMEWKLLPVPAPGLLVWFAQLHLLLPEPRYQPVVRKVALGALQVKGLHGSLSPAPFCPGPRRESGGERRRL